MNSIKCQDFVIFSFKRRMKKDEHIMKKFKCQQYFHCFIFLHTSSICILVQLLVEYGNYFNKCHIYEVWCLLATLQIRAGQLSISTNLWPLIAHIYHVMIIMTSSFSKKSFYYYYFYFVESFLNNLELVFFELLNIGNSFLFCAQEQAFKLMTGFF